MSKKLLKLRIRDLQEGMIPGISIMDLENGKIILKKGIELQKEDILRIKDYFANKEHVELGKVEVEENIFSFNGKEVYLPSKNSKYYQSSLSSEIYQKMLSNISDIINNATFAKKMDIKKLRITTADIVEKIYENEDMLINILDIKNYDDYLYIHSVNVGLLSILIGVKLGLQRDELIELGVGGFLHDLGKIKLPSKLLNKKEKLKQEEFKKIARHPVYTYELLKNEDKISIASKRAVLEHHENYDGSGYPRGLTGNELHLFSKIVAIADTYDAITSKRAFKDSNKPYEAMKAIISNSGKRFDPEIVSKFLKFFSIYPLGSYVKLNTNEIGVIVKSNPESILRPIILVVKNSEGEEIESYQLDLGEEKRKYIIGAVELED